jgi:putative secretion ATPase (PEP-CTERM system associated)
MYNDFYKLTGKPFQLSPNPRFFFGSSGHQKAISYLQYGLHQGEGFIVITGDVGAGKTTLIGYLTAQLDPAKYLAAKLVTTQIEADDTLRMVASAFGLETRGVDKASLLRSFERFALDNQRRGRRILVIVDEVQNLPMKSLEELRMLSNFQVNDIAAVQFCLLGQPQFRDILASDDLAQLRQRVVATYHLGPLSPDETRAYVEHRLQLVAWQRDPDLTDDAYAHIHAATAGVPRQINVLCDRLFLYGMIEELHHLEARDVDAVASEMAGEGMRAERDTAPLPTAPLSPNAQAAIAQCQDRLSALEKTVTVHDKTIKRGIELAASYLNQEIHTPKQPNNDAPQHQPHAISR